MNGKGNKQGTVLPHCTRVRPIETEYFCLVCCSLRGQCVAPCGRMASTSTTAAEVNAKLLARIGVGFTRVGTGHSVQGKRVLPHAAYELTTGLSDGVATEWRHSAANSEWARLESGRIPEDKAKASRLMELAKAASMLGSTDVDTYVLCKMRNHVSREWLAVHRMQTVHVTALCMHDVR